MALCWSAAASLRISCRWSFRCSNSDITHSSWLRCCYFSSAITTSSSCSLLMPSIVSAEMSIILQLIPGPDSLNNRCVNDTKLVPAHSGKSFGQLSIFPASLTVTNTVQNRPSVRSFQRIRQTDFTIISPRGDYFVPFELSGNSGMLAATLPAWPRLEPSRRSPPAETSRRTSNRTGDSCERVCSPAAHPPYGMAVWLLFLYLHGPRIYSAIDQHLKYVGLTVFCHRFPPEYPTCF